MPGLAGVPDPVLNVLQLPVPVMQTVLQCPYNATLPEVAQPMLLDGFPRVVHVQLVATRQVLGVTLTSGMETVMTSALLPGSTTLAPFSMAFPAAIPTQMTLATPSQGSVDLAGDSDGLAIGPAAGAFTFAFVPEAGVDLRADYYDVILHRISGGALTTERIYTVTAPQVRIDGATLASGADYVFEIRSYKGHPKALHGDFSAVDYPYGSAIVFTRTFKTS